MEDLEQKEQIRKLRRQGLAGMAMLGLIADNGCRSPAGAAEDAYKYADAMLRYEDELEAKGK